MNRSLAPLLRALSLPLLAGLLPGCQSAKDALISCLYDFEATVQTGTNAGAEVTGQLSLSEGEDGAMSASMSETNTDGVDVDAEVVDGEITLTFNVPALGEIVGTGSFDADSCLDSIEGELTGPAEDDAGDWAGTLIVE